MHGHALLTCLAFLLWAMTGLARADSQPTWLTDKALATLFPDALYVGPLSGDPPAAKVYGAGTTLGYVFATSDIVDAVGFSGAPFTMAVGLDIDGTIAGVTMVEHAEPILNYNTLTESVTRFIDQYRGLDYTGAVRLSAGGQRGDIDGISTATISARAFHHAVIHSARSVARSRGLRSAEMLSASIDMLRFEPLTWAELVDSGVVKRLDIDYQSAVKSNSGEVASSATELHVALLNPASVGRNLLSRSTYQNYVSSKSPRDLIIALMSNGPYSFVGKKVFETGTFDRIQIAQGKERYPLVRQLGRYHYLPFLSADAAPSFSEIGLFTLPAESGIDVLAPWDLLVDVRDEENPASAVREFKLTYQLPTRFVLPPAKPLAAAPQHSQMRAAWRAQTAKLAILVTALCVLTLILVLMGHLTRRPRLLRAVRTSFLLFTLVWLGWIAGAQLSVINPIAWVQALVSGAGLDMLLNDPLLVVLTGFVLMSFVAWGRGVFCGWLCPFGALQELLASLARRVGLSQIALSHRVHRMLWPVKYLVLITLIGAAFHTPTSLGFAAEIEPFKTVITLKFDRAWPFVFYAATLLVTGLFIERAFCRFLCPLGALLAIGGKLRLRNPLKRREECGSPCQLCTQRCPIQAIAPNGQIDMDECFYCLDCQVIYHDEHQCPPLLTRHKRAIRTSEPQPIVITKT